MKYPAQAYAYTKSDVNEAVRLATEELRAEVERLSRERDEALEGWHLEMPNASTAPLK